ncbi:MAG TPA: hypothetical protein PLK12_04650 [Prolixibacteraceae bacterium]|nr:hypothetical protein [Prolixibacteraceae bacterium]
MYWILSKKTLPDGLTRLEVQAPEWISAFQPGHHLLAKISPQSPGIPCVIWGVQPERRSLFLILSDQHVDQLSLSGLAVGDVLHSLTGPYGEPISLSVPGTVICAAGANSILPMLPVVEALKKSGNRVLTVLGARSRDYFVLENEFRAHSDEVLFLTDDGSSGQKGLVCEGVQAMIRREKVDHVIAIGALNMIRHSAQLTRRFDLPLTAILYAPYVDATGISGIYRISLCDRSKYICVDGPELNAYYPDFDILKERLCERLSDDFAGNQNYRKTPVF